MLLGTFQYLFKGFSKPPTTHYSRPFHLAYFADRLDNYTCEYGRSMFQVNMDYVDDFLHTYKDTGFFGISHISMYTHNEQLNDIRNLDDSLFEYFQKFHNDRTVSDNTVLFVYSDHGPRYPKERKAIKGLLNERNPFFSVYIPPLFKQRYPNEYKSITENTNKLVTAIDIHTTLMNILDLETGQVKPRSAEKVYEKKRALSLFSDIAPDRTCEDAVIHPYFCACIKKTEIRVDEYTRSLAQVFIDYINNVLLNDTLDLCHKLEIDQINAVYTLDTYLNSSDSSTFRFKNSKEEPKRADNEQSATRSRKDNNKFEVKAKIDLIELPRIEINHKKYLFFVRTKPNNGQFEFSLNVKLDSKTSEGISLDEKQISRTNKYGNDEHCIHEKYPELRKYCYCRDKPK